MVDVVEVFCSHLRPNFAEQQQLSFNIQVVSDDPMQRFESLVGWWQRCRSVVQLSGGILNYEYFLLHHWVNSMRKRNHQLKGGR